MPNWRKSRQCKSLIFFGWFFVLFYLSRSLSPSVFQNGVWIFFVFIFRIGSWCWKQDINTTCSLLIVEKCSKHLTHLCISCYCVPLSNFQGSSQLHMKKPNEFFWKQLIFPGFFSMIFLIWNGKNQLKYHKVVIH